MANHQETHLLPVSYSKESNEEVKRFKSLPKELRVASYWDDLQNGNLKFLKSEIKNHYLQQQGHTCAYCQQRIIVEHGAAWDTDHIIPKDSHPDFMFEAENLCITCKDCNNTKRAKNVLRNQKRVKFPKKPSDYIFCHPHFHNYKEHIRVVRVAALYIPRTPEGIKTIEICGLMRFSLKFANYEYSDTGNSLKIHELSSELISAESPTEQAAILNMIATLVRDGLDNASRSGLASRGM
ncbi:HNH endonuclease [Pseudomonas putida]|uniref:HNH endonuclease n=1 Tax=Pseudomonas putida TaxID=303 RepID=UPI0035710735